MTKPIQSLQDYLLAILPYQQRVFSQIHRFGTERPALLFRGQKKGVPLVSKISEIVNKNNIRRVISFERARLEFIKKDRSECRSYWDALAVAQHYGIATRFLDWSSNSLIALFFALGRTNTSKCQVERTPEIWLLETINEDFEESKSPQSPIPEEKGEKTCIFTPRCEYKSNASSIYERIGRQDSYLMRQVYVKDSKGRLFIESVDKNPTFAGRLHRIELTADSQAIQRMRDEIAEYGYKGELILPEDVDLNNLKVKCDSLIARYASNKNN